MRRRRNLSGAPRLPVASWRGFARGAWLACALVGSGAAAAGPCVVSATYDAPTDRYAHAVLGDAIEYGALVMQTRAAEGEATRTVRVRLPESRVFEDIAPRLVDMDADGCAEVAVVESEQQTGAQLALYSGAGEKIAATPHIGRRNRWLAPIGAADLDGDGRIEIAYVDRPHLAKTLRVWRFVEDTLVEVAALPGVSNHRIGWDYIEGGLRDCGDGPEMVLASGDWRHVVAVRFDGELDARALGPYSAGRVSSALACS